MQSLLLTHNAPAQFAPARSNTGATCFFVSIWQVKRSIHNSSVCPAQSQRISWASWPSLGNLLPKRLIFSTNKFVRARLVCTTWIRNRWSGPMRSETDAGFLQAESLLQLLKAVLITSMAALSWLTRTYKGGVTRYIPGEDSVIIPLPHPDCVNRWQHLDVLACQLQLLIDIKKWINGAPRLDLFKNLARSRCWNVCNFNVSIVACKAWICTGDVRWAAIASTIGGDTAMWPRSEWVRKTWLVMCISANERFPAPVSASSNTSWSIGSDVVWQSLARGSGHPNTRIFTALFYFANWTTSAKIAIFFYKIFPVQELRPKPLNFFFSVAADLMCLIAAGNKRVCCLSVARNTNESVFLRWKLMRPKPNQVQRLLLTSLMKKANTWATTESCFASIRSFLRF